MRLVLNNNDQLKKTKLLWYLAGSIFIFSSNGKWMTPFSIWIVLICFLRFSRANKPLAGFIPILIISSFSNLLIWKGFIPLPSPLYFIVSFINGLIFTLPFLVERLLIKRQTNYTQTLIFPALLTLFSYLYSLISPSGTFGSIAYSQSNIFFIQIVSLTGIWGVIFILGWTASTINYLIDNRANKDKIYSSLVVYLSIIIFVLIYGGIRISDSKADQTIKVAGIVNNCSYNKSIRENLDDFIKSSGNNAESMFTQTKECVQNGANIVFWREAAVIVLDSLEDSLITKAKDIARENEIYLGISVMSLSKDFPKKPGKNEIIWIDPKGKVGFKYLKAYPAPSEIVLKGDKQPKIISSASFNLSSAICFDMNFPGFIREFGKKKVDILCVPANDWKEITPYHANISAFRGIENGFSVIRTTGNGLSAAFNSDGSKISELNYFNSPQRILYADVQTHKRCALYPLVGDFLPWLSLLLVLIITVKPVIENKVNKIIFCFIKTSEG
jgi:apolipoprotein N-acyltransferase